MSYPELDWRASFHQQVKNRKSLFEIVISPRKSLKPPEGPGNKYELDFLKPYKFQHIRECEIQLEDPCELETILGQNKIDNKLLYDLAPHPQLLSNKSFLPLEWFDDFEYDPMSAERWLSLDNPTAFALIPDPHSLEWAWRSVTVINYNERNYLWKVNMNDSLWDVPRIRLYFVYENPIFFVERIRAALDSRNEAENCCRFNYLRQLVDVEDFFNISARLSQRLFDTSGKEALNAFQIIYRKFHIMLSLNPYLEQNKWLNVRPVSGKTENIPPSFKNDVRSIYDFQIPLSTIRRIILLCHPAVISAIGIVHSECEKVRSKNLFSLSYEAPITLADFKVNNERHLQAISKVLKIDWIKNTTEKIYECLLETGRGWFDVTVDSWTVYQFMKLNRLITQIKLRMQAALRDLAIESAKEFCRQLGGPCSSALLLEEDFTWQGDLINSPFDSGEQPVFSLLLEMGHDVPYYSTNPDDFPSCLGTLFDQAIVECHDIHVVDPCLLGSLIFDPHLCLSSVGMFDPEIQRTREYLALLYRKIIIPLKAYAARFMEFKDLFFTNIQEYLENIRLNKSSLQVKEEISFQKRLCKSLEQTLPYDIVIGSFWINVQPLRKALIEKRRDLISALLTMLTARLSSKTSAVLADYNEIIVQMCANPISIEHVYEIRAFMETVPKQVENLEDRMKNVLFEYDILDYFRYALPDSDFNQKREVLAFPLLIKKQMNTVYEFHEGQVDIFRKHQVGDEAEFDSQVEEINVQISKFTTIYDVSKVHEISIEVNTLWTAIDKLISRGETLNKRQILFELPAINLSTLFEMRKSFESYKNLWLFAAEFTSLEENWRREPLSQVDVESATNAVSQYKENFESLMSQFEEQPQIQTCVFTFLDKAKSFEPYLTVIQLLQHPILEPVHWSQLGETTGISEKLSLESNFNTFLANNIEQHLNVIHELIQRAEEQKTESIRIKAEQEEIQRKEQEYLKARLMRRLKRSEI